MFKCPALLAVLAATALLAGCSSSTGPSSAETLDDYWIQGYYCYYPPAQRSLNWDPCVIFVRSGGADGDAVSGLNVTCNGYALSFQQTAYYSDVSDIEPGQDVTLRVSDGTRAVELTLAVPGSPTGLVLEEGSWDFSSASGTHTLTWENPAVLADSVLAAVAGQGVHPMMIYVHMQQLPSSAAQVTLSNSSMSGFDGTTNISCSLTQGVRGEFPGHSGGSEMWVRAGVVKEWAR